MDPSEAFGSGASLLRAQSQIRSAKARLTTNFSSEANSRFSRTSIEGDMIKTGRCRKQRTGGSLTSRWGSTERSRSIGRAAAEGGKILVDAGSKLIVGEHAAFVCVPRVEPFGKTLSEFFAGYRVIFVGVQSAHEGASQKHSWTESARPTRPAAAAPAAKAEVAHGLPLGFARDLVDHRLCAHGYKTLDRLRRLKKTAGP